MRFGKLAIALSVGLLAASAGMAQQQPQRGQPGGGFGGRGGGGVTTLVANKSVQDELKVDKDQADKVTAALTKVGEDLAADTAKLRDRNTPQEEQTLIRKKISDAREKALESVLKSDQLKRLHQIDNQQAKAGIFKKEDVKKALNLNDLQQEKIGLIDEDLQKDLASLGGQPGRGAAPGGTPGGTPNRGTRPGAGGTGGRGGNDPEAAKKRDDVQAAAMAKMVKVLNDSQKAALKDLTGEPFVLVQAPGAGFPGGGTGGRGTGGFAGFGQPGQVLSAGIQTTLKLTDEQKKKVEDLQKEVDAQLAKILTDDQKKQMKELPQGFGGGRGGRAPGGAGNPPPPNDR